MDTTFAPTATVLAATLKAGDFVRTIQRGPRNRGLACNTSLKALVPMGGGKVRLVFWTGVAVVIEANRAVTADVAL